MMEIVQNHTSDALCILYIFKKPSFIEYTVMEENYFYWSKHTEETETSLNFFRSKRLNLRHSNLKMRHRIPNFEILVSA